MDRPGQRGRDCGMGEISRTDVQGEERLVRQASHRRSGEDAFDCKGLELRAETDLRRLGKPAIGRPNRFGREPTETLIADHGAADQREDRLERGSVQVWGRQETGNPPSSIDLSWAHPGVRSAGDRKILHWSVSRVWPDPPIRRLLSSPAKVEFTNNVPHCAEGSGARIPPGRPRTSSIPGDRHQAHRDSSVEAAGRASPSVLSRRRYGNGRNQCPGPRQAVMRMARWGSDGRGECRLSANRVSGRGPRRR